MEEWDINFKKYNNTIIKFTKINQTRQHKNFL